MIALDTSVLVRLVLHDDEAQARAAERLVIKARREQTHLFVADVVWCELQLFDSALAAKPQLVVANKIDAIDPEGDTERIAALARRAAELGLPFFRISGVTGAGVPELLEAVWQRLTHREAA